jgi:transposase
MTALAQSRYLTEAERGQAERLKQARARMGHVVASKPVVIPFAPVKLEVPAPLPRGNDNATHRKWSEDEERVFAEMVRMGLTARNIAKRLNRSYGTVKSKRRRLLGKGFKEPLNLARIPVPPVSIEFSKRPIARIIEETAFFFGFTVKQLIAPNRRLHVVVPRQIAIWRVRKEVGASLNQIGVNVGHRDHTTILSAIRKVDEKIAAGEIILPEGWGRAPE